MNELNETRCQLEHADNRIAQLNANVEQLRERNKELEATIQEQYDAIDSVEMDLTQSYNRIAWLRDRLNKCTDRSNQDRYT